MNKCCVKGTKENNLLNKLSESLKAISDPTRLKILCLLQDGERCVCDIFEPLDLPQNLVSHHLKVLRDERLVLSRREGKWIQYRLNNKKIDELEKYLKNILMGGKKKNDS